MHPNRMSWMKLLPAGNGWNVKVVRLLREPYKYYGVSRSTVKRLNRIINRDGYDNYNVELGFTGWCEIELYPDPVLNQPEAR